jgi:Cu2+-containing amine oxidase
MSCSHDGEPVVIPNAICIHEQDAGLGSKHTNIRTGRADVTRTRELVFQLIVTVGNYEYALYWIFGEENLLLSPTFPTDAPFRQIPPLPSTTRSARPAS